MLKIKLVLLFHYLKIPLKPLFLKDITSIYTQKKSCFYSLWFIIDHLGKSVKDRSNCLKSFFSFFCCKKLSVDSLANGTPKKYNNLKKKPPQKKERNQNFPKSNFLKPKGKKITGQL